MDVKLDGLVKSQKTRFFSLFNRYVAKNDKKTSMIKNGAFRSGKPHFRGKVSGRFAGERFQQASMVKICYQSMALVGRGPW